MEINEGEKGLSVPTAQRRGFQKEDGKEEITKGSPTGLVDRATRQESKGPVLGKS